MTPDDWNLSQKHEASAIALIEALARKHASINAVKASYKEDTQEGTDIIVRMGQEIRIAYRIRRAHHIRFKDEFTIRSGYINRPNVETEIHKIRRGLVDCMFYCFERTDRSEIGEWAFIDLHKWRANETPFVLEDVNKDGVTKFRSYKIKEWFLIDASWLRTEEAAA